MISRFYQGRKLCNARRYRTFINRKTFVQTKSDFCNTLPIHETLPVPLQLSIFPNPTQQKITIIGLPIKAKFEIANPQGGIIIKGQSSENPSCIDVSGLPSGIYFLRSGGALQRFVKE
jgi:Secretion system C-terminal sorting domain